MGRVKGLRREEVALLAGVSIDYYIRMERGDKSANAKFSAGSPDHPAGSRGPTRQVITTPGGRTPREGHP